MTQAVRQKGIKHRIRPVQVLPLGFLALILVGSLLLLLPIATPDGARPLTVLEAMFTATSASCVTGLVVADTGTQFSTFGQAVILFLIQVGGLGFMTLTTLLFMMIGKRISLSERLTIAEALNADHVQGVVRLVIHALEFTFCFELIGAAALCIRFIPQFGPARGIWYALFHSISAFCNAGFDLMGDYSSFLAYRGDVLVNTVLMILITVGGLGFTVLADLEQKRRFTRLNLHTKLVLTVSAILILLGAGVTLITEYTNPATLGGLPFGEKVLSSLFQSVTWRTAGFNTIDQLSLRDSTKLFGCILMCIGASPAGTGGGIKTTTVALVFLGITSVLNGRADVTLWRRRINWNIVRRAFAVFMIFVCIILAVTFLISCIEVNRPAGLLGMENQLYEVSSALGTVGLSVGVTSMLSDFSRVLIMLCMFAGRIGPLTMMLALAGRSGSHGGIRYPEETLLVG